MEAKEIINSIYSLLKLEVENDLKVIDNEIIISFKGNETNKIKITKIK